MRQLVKDRGHTLDGPDNPTYYPRLEPTLRRAEVLPVFSNHRQSQYNGAYGCYER
jgi:hypothetical protein